MTSEKQFKRPRMRVNRRFLMRRMVCCWPWFLFIGAALAAILLLPGGLGSARLRANAEYIYSYVSATTAGELTKLDVALGDSVEVGQVIGRLKRNVQNAGAEEQCELRAEASGVVTGVLCQVGDSVDVGEAVVRIGQPSTRRVTAFVPPDYRRNLCVGKRCCVVAQDGKKTYQGKVLFVPSNALANGESVPNEERITIELMDGELFPGEAVAVVANHSVLNHWFEM
ncbi:MAG: HlyD family secretion protein [Pontiellaceae bacterium]|nr:HlyD family secretion protein [Pontiellaceae bacterium]